jgi:hypothetical protein
MGDLLGSLVRGIKKQIILCRWGWVVTNGIRAIVQPEMRGCALIYKGRQRELARIPRIG